MRYAAEMYKHAAGWLGWPPDVALDTPFPLISLAMDGLMDRIVKTNPFGSKGSGKHVETFRPQSEDIAGQVREAMAMMGAKPAKQGRAGDG